MKRAQSELGFTPSFTPATGIADYVRLLEGSSN